MPIGVKEPERDDVGGGGGGVCIRIRIYAPGGWLAYSVVVMVVAWVRR